MKINKLEGGVGGGAGGVKCVYSKVEKIYIIHYISSLNLERSIIYQLCGNQFLQNTGKLPISNKESLNSKVHIVLWLKIVENLSPLNTE